MAALVHSAVWPQGPNAGLSVPQVETLLRPGLRLSHYRLLEKIGEGGMGVVWKAEDTLLGRMVAVKFLPPALVADAAHRGMLLNEARLASSVAAANVVPVHDFGRDRELDFIVMEYVDGVALEQEIKGNPVPARRVAHLGLQIARALSIAHGQGLVHRDLKPANILVTAADEVKVLDFGLAMLLDDADKNLLSEAPTCDPVHDRKAELCGTIAYMSPEQARREPVDARSDIFSLGAILYQMASGALPFAGPTSLDVLKAVEKALPRRVRERVPAVPVELERIIHKALARLPQDRYQHMDEIAVDLRHLRSRLQAPENAPVPTASPPRRKALPFRRLLQAAALVLGVWALSWGSGPAPKLPTRAWGLAPQERFSQPTWSPAGNLIAYASDEAGNQDIWISDPSGANPMNLTGQSPGRDSSPAWSPDGRRIAFYSDRDGGGIFTMMVLGGDVRARLSLSSPPRSLRWSDRGALVFETADPDGETQMYSLAREAVRPECLTCP